MCVCENRSNKEIYKCLGLFEKVLTKVYLTMVCLTLCVNIVCRIVLHFNTFF